MWCWWLPPMMLPVAAAIVAAYWYNPPYWPDWMSFDEQKEDADRGRDGRDDD